MPEIHPFFVFEIAQGVDLDEAERLLGSASARQTFRHRGRATTWFRFRPAPVRITQQAGPIPVGRWSTGAEVDLVLYDFGSVSVAYHVPLEGDLEQLKDASAALQQTQALREDARGRADDLIRSLGRAVQNPRQADFAEDYAIFGLREGVGPVGAERYCRDHGRTIAQILRPNPGGLSEQETADATALRISFGPGDLTIVDWDAAFVLDPEPEDVRAVLDFANVQLLEMRWLDQELDRAIERSYHLLAPQPAWKTVLPGTLAEDVRQVAELQLESVVLLERVSNAIKVFGEEYLARIYRLAARRFQLAELEHGIVRKLETLESIYQKLTDRAATFRLEALEWVVIILIATEIVLGLVG